MADLKFTNNILLITILICLLFLSSSILIYFLYLQRKYNFQIKYSIIDSKKLSLFFKAGKKSQTIPLDKTTVESIPVDFFVLSLVIALMINDGPNPCELEKNISLNSSYDENCRNSLISLF